MISDTDREFGCRLRLRRRLLGLTQQEVATALGVKRQAVAQYETGRCRPGAERLAALAAALGDPALAPLGRPSYPNQIYPTWGNGGGRADLPGPRLRRLTPRLTPRPTTAPTRRPRPRPGCTRCCPG